MTYIIVLKVTKFSEDQLNRFWDFQQKPSLQMGLKNNILEIRPH